MLLAAACVGSTDVPAVSVWETVLQPELAYPEVGGQAAAVSEPSGTSVSVLLTGADAGAEHAWGLRQGTCAAPGAQIGPASDYGDLVVGLSGSAEADAHLGSRLALEQSYHIDVRVSAADDSRVACGDLIAR
jgi:hypothetical protein